MLAHCLPVGPAGPEAHHGCGPGWASQLAPQAGPLAVTNSHEQCQRGQRQMCLSRLHGPAQTNWQWEFALQQQQLRGLGGVCIVPVQLGPQLQCTPACHRHQVVVRAHTVHWADQNPSIMPGCSRTTSATIPSPLPFYPGACADAAPGAGSGPWSEPSTASISWPAIRSCTRALSRVQGTTHK